jgi:lariat debranching enzyme
MSLELPPVASPSAVSYLRVAVVGCSHGELEAIYSAAAAASAASSDARPVDLVICCGDFQAVRNGADLACMACPPKYRAMHSFWRVYSGLEEAPIKTLFIGGNHEATNHAAELPFGGWAARRVWFMGSAGVVSFGGVRIGGVSGIFKGPSFNHGYHERAPYSGSGELHTSGHQRGFDFWRLGALAGAPPAPLDVMLSHDWPEGVYRYGDTAALVRAKPFFEPDIQRGDLGSPPSMALLNAVRPRFWFSGHLHTKFAALVPHADGSATRFLALDKPIPGRSFLQVLDIPRREAAPHDFAYDPLWMAIAVKAHALTPVGARAPPLPQAPPCPTMEEIASVASALAKFSARASGLDDAAASAAARAAAADPLKAVRIPDNFQASAPIFDPRASNGLHERPPPQCGNPQTDALLEALGLRHMTTIPFGSVGGWVAPPPTAVAAGAPLIRPDSGSAAAEMRAFQAASAAAFAGAHAWQASMENRVAAPPVAPDANEINLDEL